VNRSKITFEEAFDEQHSKLKQHGMGLQVSPGMGSEVSQDASVRTIAPVSGKRIA
jgi:hypothetical protein